MRKAKNYKNIKDTLETVILDISRVSRVTAGGKRLSFRVTLIVGDKSNFRVGLGIGKGKDVAQAIEKATADAQKHFITIPVKNGTIPFEVAAKEGAAQVIIKPAKEGKGVVAGGVVRSILRLGGVTNVTAKIIGRTTNSISNSRATLKALEQLAQAKPK